MLCSFFTRGVNRREGIHNVLQKGKANGKKIWILLAFHCNCVYVHYVGKEKYLEVPHLIVRNGHLWKVEFGE